jgi:hypothetical protein
VLAFAGTKIRSHDLKDKTKGTNHLVRSGLVIIWWHGRLKQYLKRDLDPNVELQQRNRSVMGKIQTRAEAFRLDCRRNRDEQMEDMGLAMARG